MSAAKPTSGWPLLPPHAAAARSLLDEAPHPYARLAERAQGVCLLARLWAQSEASRRGVRPSAR
jgi:hypothetical protein